MSTNRHTNKGLRKVCAHPRRRWSECEHSWYFNFKWQGTHYRLSLDKYLGKHIDSKSAAEDAAADIRKQIKAGTFGQPAPVLDRLTMGQLLDAYMTRYVEVERKDSVENVTYQIALIKRTEIDRLDGKRQPFGEWLVADVSTDTIDRFKERRRAQGIVAANRDLALLRAAFNWGIRKKQVRETPFKLGTETVVKLSDEHPRSRRLAPGEGEALLGVCSPHLRALVEAALETGCRRGELLSLQWKQVEGITVDGTTITWAPKATLFLPHQKTKTKKDRWIPISSRLKAILEMRRFDPKGEPHALDKFVFGSEVGTKVDGFGRAWDTAVLKSHGHTPTYTKTANLTPESRAALQEIGLRFHDLRREAGSRWLDRGMPLHAVRDLLGHSNVSQTSTYLATTSASLHDAMHTYETALQQIATPVETGGRKRPRKAKRRDKRTNETAVGRDQPIM
jgi:integrase